MPRRTRKTIPQIPSPSQPCTGGKERDIYYPYKCYKTCKKTQTRDPFNKRCGKKVVKLPGRDYSKTGTLCDHGQRKHPDTGYCRAWNNFSNDEQAAWNRIHKDELFQRALERNELAAALRDGRSPIKPDESRPASIVPRRIVEEDDEDEVPSLQPPAVGGLRGLKRRYREVFSKHNNLRQQLGLDEIPRNISLINGNVQSRIQLDLERIIGENESLQQQLDLRNIVNNEEVLARIQFEQRADDLNVEIGKIKADPTYIMENRDRVLYIIDAFRALI